MNSRFNFTRLALFAVLLAFVACSDGGPADPQGSLQFEGTPGLSAETPTAKDEEFLPELKVGYFTICKVAEGQTQKYSFVINAEGPGVAQAPLYVQNVDLGDGECADVYQAPMGAGIDGDLVTITEILPKDCRVARVAVWSRDEVEPGVYETTFHTEPAGTTSVQGTIDAEKQGCVVIFYNECEPDEPGECTRTPGYWKTHPEAWPVEEITIGGVTYSKEEAIEILWMAEQGDKTKTVFRALVAAMLNMYNGTDTECVDEELADADDWLATYGVCTNVRGNSDAWQGGGETLYTTLDDYNNGRLDCADHCEDGDDRDDDDGERAVSFD